ncbi:MAG TPA: response regulator [Polyangiaceae bacterium]|jgi:YesN/AraC family two-component response regulator
MTTPRSFVVFVDDEPRVLEALQRALRPHRGEWEVAIATDARGALSILRARPVDVLVTDMRMPEVSGVDLLEQVRELQPGAARFVLSGQTDFDAVMRSVALAHRFLGKPCGPQTMLQMIVSARDAVAWIDDERIRAGLVARTTLPSRPDAFKRLEDALAGNPSPVELSEIIADDVAMSIKVLQVVRAPFFGGTAASVTVADAVRELGAKVIRALAENAFRAAPWPCGLDPRTLQEGTLATRAGRLLHATVPATDLLPPETLGATLLNLWGVGAGQNHVSEGS